MREVVRGCKFSLFPACKAREAGECARAKPAVYREGSAESKQEQSEKSRQRSGRERAEGPSLCHCGAKLLWSCSCQCCSLGGVGAWPPWYHTPGCQNKGVPAWEKLLHHILHMWERSSTDEQKSRRKSKTNRCGSH